MLESARKVHASSSLPYELLITRILLFYSIDHSAYPPVEVARTYNSRAFSSMGYVLVDDEWCKKESTCAKAEPPKVSKSASNPFTSLIKDLKNSINGLKPLRKVS
ncbi:hypothetical protein FXO38_32120 [Capsicum annuum]|nr:hypothetical protein FXO38_32120 [Capsicum annuum]